MILGLSSADGGMTVGLWRLSSLDGRRPPWYRPLVWFTKAKRKSLLTYCFYNHRRDPHLPPDPTHIPPHRQSHLPPDVISSQAGDVPGWHRSPVWCHLCVSMHPQTDVVTTHRYLPPLWASSSTYDSRAEVWDPAPSPPHPRPPSPLPASCCAQSRLTSNWQTGTPVATLVRRLAW